MYNSKKKLKDGGGTCWFLLLLVLKRRSCRGWQLLSQISCNCVPLHNLHYYHLHLLAMCQRVQRKDIPSISPFSWSPLKALSGPLSPFTVLSYLILPFISSALGFHLLLCQATLSLPAGCSPYPVCHTFIIYVPFFLAVIATSQRPPTITTSKDKSIMLLFVQEGQIHVTSISWAMHLRNSMNDKLIWVWVLEWAVCHKWVFKKLKILGSHQERRIIVWQYGKVSFSRILLAVIITTTCHTEAQKYCTNVGLQSFLPICSFSALGTGAGARASASGRSSESTCVPHPLQQWQRWQETAWLFRASPFVKQP